MRAFSIIASHKNLSLRHHHVNLTRTIFLWPIILIHPRRLIWRKSIWKFFVINCQNPILNRHSLTRKSNHPLNNILISLTHRSFAGQRTSSLTICKYDNLTSLRHILTPPEMRPSHRQTIYNNPIIIMQSILHT